MLSCPTEPAVPGPGATQRDVARWIVKVSEAGDDCRARLLAVSRVVSHDAVKPVD